MTEPVTTPHGAVHPSLAMALHLRHEVAQFECLRERAHEQIAALAVTIARLERLREDIDRRLPHTLE